MPNKNTIVGLFQGTLASFAALSISLSGNPSLAEEGQKVEQEGVNVPHADMIAQIVVPALVLSFAKGAMDKLKS